MDLNLMHRSGFRGSAVIKRKYRLLAKQHVSPTPALQRILEPLGGDWGKHEVRGLKRVRNSAAPSRDVHSPWFALPDEYTR